MDQTCEYCERYYRSQVRAGQNIGIRTCKSHLKMGGKLKPRLIEKDVEITDSVCKNFRPAKFIFCDKYHQWVPPKVCRWRKEVNLYAAYNDCQKCPQYEKHIVDFFEKRTELEKKRKIKVFSIPRPIKRLKKRRPVVKTLKRRRKK